MEPNELMRGSPGRRIPDYYDILGVAPDAPFREIEAAYWRLATRPESRDRLALLNEAYEVLGDGERRVTYDRHRPRRGEARPERRPQLEAPPRANPGLRRKLRWYLQ